MTRPKRDPMKCAHCGRKKIIPAWLYCDDIDCRKSRQKMLTVNKFTNSYKKYKISMETTNKAEEILIELQEVLAPVFFKMVQDTAYELKEDRELSESNVIEACEAHGINYEMVRRSMT